MRSEAHGNESRCSKVWQTKGRWAVSFCRSIAPTDDTHAGKARAPRLYTCGCVCVFRHPLRFHLHGDMLQAKRVAHADGGTHHSPNTACAGTPLCELRTHDATGGARDALAPNIAAGLLLQRGGPRPKSYGPVQTCAGVPSCCVGELWRWPCWSVSRGATTACLEDKAASARPVSSAARHICVVGAGRRRSLAAASDDR